MEQCFGVDAETIDFYQLAVYLNQNVTSCVRVCMCVHMYVGGVCVCVCVCTRAHTQNQRSALDIVPQVTILLGL